MVKQCQKRILKLKQIVLLFQVFCRATPFLSFYEESDQDVTFLGTESAKKRGVWVKFLLQTRRRTYLLALPFAHYVVAIIASVINKFTCWEKRNRKKTPSTAYIVCLHWS